MSVTATGLVVFLLSVPVVRGGWGVTYTSTELCAPKGSTVDMNCTYSYPSGEEVTRTFWYTEDIENDVESDPDYTGRVTYICDKNSCTLRITNLRDGDSAKYWFRFITESQGGKYTGEPGVQLAVTALQIRVTTVKVHQSSTEAQLSCQSSCTSPSYVWLKNGQKVPEEASSYTGHFKPGDSISCALKGLEDYHTPSLYAPKIPSVSLSPSGEIMEASSVNLTCSSDANIIVNFTWYKKTLNPNHKPLSKGPQLIFSLIQSSDSGDYYCTAENQLGGRTSGYFSINVQYAPKTFSVSVSPSGEIAEGDSVNLTCSSDANPAANYTWYKENQTLLQGPEGFHHFTSISSEDRGIYYCKTENQHGQITSSPQVIDVLYAPKRPSVSVSPSGEIKEGDSVNLTCSSDANPAANYTWYKENEDSPKASGQTFTITDFRSEHSGNYYCEAQNNRGRHNSSLHLSFEAGVPGGKTFLALGIVTALSVVGVLVFVFLWRWNKWKSKQPSESIEEPDAGAQKQPAEREDCLHYATVHFSKKQADPLYSNTSPHKNEEQVDRVEYASIKFNSGNTAPGCAALHTGL